MDRYSGSERAPRDPGCTTSRGVGDMIQVSVATSATLNECGARVASFAPWAAAELI